MKRAKRDFYETDRGWIPFPHFPSMRSGKKRLKSLKQFYEENFLKYDTKTKIKK